MWTLNILQNLTKSTSDGKFTLRKHRMKDKSPFMETSKERELTYVWTIYSIYMFSLIIFPL